MESCLRIDDVNLISSCIYAYHKLMYLVLKTGNDVNTIFSDKNS